MTLDTHLVNRIHAALGEALDERDAADEARGERPMGPGDRRQYANHLISRQLADLDSSRLADGSAPLSGDEAANLATAVLNRLFGLGRLQAYVDDPQWTDIHANGFDQVWLTRRDGTIVEGDPIADSDADLVELIQTQARRGRSEQRWDPASPELDMRLPSGDRLHAIAWVSGRPSVSIRRHNFDIADLKQLIGLGTISESLYHLLSAMVAARFNIIVAGGTGAGKTTLLRCLLNEVDSDERIITVEDAAEVQLKQEHVITLESRPANIEGKGLVNTRDLVRNALRMRPERIIIGECRNGCAAKRQAQNHCRHECPPHLPSPCRSCLKT